MAEPQPITAPFPQHQNVLVSSEQFPDDRTLRFISRQYFPLGMPEDLLKRYFSHMKIVLNPDKDFDDPTTELRQSTTPNEGLWRLGIIAVELAYGYLPKYCTSTRERLVSMANNLVRILRLHLGSSGKRTGILTLLQDPDGKEKAKDNGENIKTMIRLPELIGLADNGYVEFLVKRIVKGKELQWDEDDENGPRKFSRDLLEVVLACLDRQNTSQEEVIVSHPFFNVSEHRVLKFPYGLGYIPNRMLFPPDVCHFYERAGSIL